MVEAHAAEVGEGAHRHGSDDLDQLLLEHRSRLAMFDLPLDQVSTGRVAHPFAQHRWLARSTVSEPRHHGGLDAFATEGCSDLERTGRRTCGDRVMPGRVAEGLPAVRFTACPGDAFTPCGLHERRTGVTDLLTKWRAVPLMWTEALRALVCLLPMLVATALDRTTYLVTLGQGAFFFSSLFLPRRLGARFVMGSLVLALGLGFYLIGGAVAPLPLGRGDLHVLRLPEPELHERHGRSADRSR